MCVTLESLSGLVWHHTELNQLVKIGFEFQNCFIFMYYKPLELETFKLISDD